MICAHCSFSQDAIRALSSQAINPRPRAAATVLHAIRRKRASVQEDSLYTVILYIDIAVCSEDDTVGDLKKLVAAQTGTRPDKIRIQKWYTIYKDHITLADYEIQDGMGLELYYN